MIGKLALTLLLASCSMVETPVKPHAPKEFSRGEVILSTQLLNKIFDQEMAPLKCVPDVDEASLLLRTINPRMEVVQDDLEAMLDIETEIEALVQTCDQNCTCSFVDELLREHLVNLDKPTRKILDQKKKQKDLASCLNYSRETFCESDLYHELNREKVDFSYEDEATP
jgi:hypothetical protein